MLQYLTCSILETMPWQLESPCQCVSVLLLRNVFEQRAACETQTQLTLHFKATSVLTNFNRLTGRDLTEH